MEYGKSFDSEDTLIIFNEIQEAPKALASLKYFYENAPQYAIMATGSLLDEIAKRETKTYLENIDNIDIR